MEMSMKREIYTSGKTTKHVNLQGVENLGSNSRKRSNERIIYG